MCNQSESDLKYYYLDYLCREVGLRTEDIDSVPLSGHADDVCSAIADKEYVIKQFEDLPFEKLKEIVCSLCDNPEITTRKHAIEYIVWIVACNIKEENNESEESEMSGTLIEIADNLRKNGGKWDFTDDSGFPMVFGHVDDTLYIGDVILSSGNIPCALIPLSHLPDEIIEMIKINM